MDREESQPLTKGNHGFKAYPWRWVNLFFFCFLGLTQNFLAFAFAPISETVVKYYKNEGLESFSLFYVNLLNAITLITAIPLFIFGPRYINRVSLRTSLFYVVVVDCVGAALRYACYRPNWLNYWFVFVGQAIISLGQVVSWAGPTKLSMIWFPDSERAFATSLGSMSNLMGIASAFSFSPLMVPNDKPENVELLLMIQTIVCFAACLSTLLFFKSAPPSAPSRSSLDLLSNTEDGPSINSDEQIPPTCCGQLKMMLKDRSFVLVSIVFGLGFGYFNGIFTVLNQMMVAKGYNNQDVGIFGVSMILSGVIGAAVAGALAGKTHRYKEIMSACCLLATGAVVWFAFAVVPDNKVIIAVSMSLIGFFALALTPVSLEVVVEYTHPIPVSSSSGVLCAWGSFLAVIFIVFFSALEDEDGTLDRANYVAIGGFSICCVLTLFLSTHYKRHLIDSE